MFWTLIEFLPSGLVILEVMDDEADCLAQLLIDSFERGENVFHCYGGGLEA